MNPNFPNLLAKIFILSLFFLGCLPKKEETKKKISIKQKSPILKENILKKGDGLGKKLALVWVEPSVRKVTSKQPARKQTPIWDGKKIHIYLAQNEWESFQVVMRSHHANFFVTPKIQKISGPSGLKSSDFRFYQSKYISVKSPSDSIGKAGTYADPLIPLKKNLQISVKENKILWITLKSKKNTVPGTYLFSLDFFSSTKKKFSIPLQVTIWNFKLSTTPSLKAYYLIDTPSIIRKFHEPKNEKKYKKLIQKYGDLLLNYGMNPGNFDLGHSKNLDLIKIDRWLTYVLDKKKLGVFCLPFSIRQIRGKAPYQSKKFEKIAQKILRKMYLHYKKKGWIQKHFIFIDGIKRYTHSQHISDEPYNGGKKSYHEMRYWANLIHKSHPKLKLMVATPPYTQAGFGKLDGYVDIYNYYVNEVDDYSKKTKELIQKGKEVFLVPNSYSDNLDYAGIFHRALGFFCFKHQLSGIEQWDVIGWYQNPREPKPNPYKGILPLKWGVGAGVLIYPGKKWAVDGPLSSIRLELNRDALEDHQYLQILSKYTSIKYAQQIASRLIPKTYSELNPREELFYKLRRFIGSEIVRMKKGGKLPPLKRGFVVDQNGKKLGGISIVSGFFSTTSDKKGIYKIYVLSSTKKILGDSFLYKKKQIQVGKKMILTKKKMKNIFSFEDKDEDYEVSFENSRGREVKVRRGERESKKYVTHGKKSLRINLPKNHSCEIGFSSFPSNWNVYTHLVVDVYNPTKNPILIVLSLMDKNKKSRELDQDVNCPGKRQVALPKQYSTLIFPLEEAKIGGMIGFYYRPALDLSNIPWFALELENEKGAGPTQIFLDHIRLMKK